MERVALTAQKRTETGKHATRELRRAGRVPIIVYGPEVEDTLHLSLDERDVERLTQRASAALVDLSIEGGEAVQLLLKAHQEDRMRGHVIHADFYQVAAGHTLHTVIPVEITGTAVGVKAGGILERAIREIEIECLPRDLPDHIVADVSELEIGDSYRVDDLPLPEGIVVRSPEGGTTLAQVVPPRVVAVAAEEGEEGIEGAEAAEAAPGEEAPAEGGEA